MTTERDLVRLMAWLSPAFPTGAFACSHGLETAIRDGRVARAEDLCAWLGGLLEHGGPWTDAVLFKAAWEADDAALDEIAELAAALAPSAERLRETTAQGEAFVAAIGAWRDPLLTSPASGRGDFGVCARLVGGRSSSEPDAPSPAGGRGEERVWAYPVAVGAACRDLPLEAALAAYLHAVTANLVSVAVRLVPLGQRAGVAVIAALEETVLATARRAAGSSLDDLGSAAFVSDIAAMRHETLPVRIFAT